YQPGGGARLLDEVGDILVEAAALDQFHAEKGPAAELADLVDRHNVRMVQVGGGLGFAAEALHVRVRGQVPGADHLEGDGAVERQLAGLVDDGHAAAA